jgi:hypothetical protein
MPGFSLLPVDTEYDRRILLGIVSALTFAQYSLLPTLIGTAIVDTDVPKMRAVIDGMLRALIGGVIVFPPVFILDKAFDPYPFLNAVVWSASPFTAELVGYAMLKYFNVPHNSSFPSPDAKASLLGEAILFAGCVTVYGSYKVIEYTCSRRKVENNLLEPAQEEIEEKAPQPERKNPYSVTAVGVFRQSKPSPQYSQIIDITDEKSLRI